MDHSSVAMNALKASLSRYVAQARAGKVVEITIHNKAVARIVGVATAPAKTGLARMVADGAVSWSGSKPTLPPRVRVAGGGTPVSQMVIEDRG